MTYWYRTLIAIVLALVLSVASVPGAQAQTALSAGAAKLDIVPPFPTLMGGFSARTEKSTGVHTPIFARALVCDNGDTRLALVAMDLVLVSRNLVEAAREAITARTGIPGGNVMITASHSHSGPSGFQDTSHYGGEQDVPLAEFLVERITEAVAQAAANMRPVEVGFANGHLDTLTRNRQGNNEVIDPGVGVLKLQVPETREVVATLFNFTGHPVILGSDNLLHSGEYPGHAQETVEQALGGVALFTQGACGDITMHRSGDPYLEIKRIGQALAGEVIKTAQQIQPQPDSTLVSQYEEFELPVREVPSLADAEEAMARATAALEAAEAAGEPAPVQARLLAERDDLSWILRTAQIKDARPALFELAAQGCVHVMQIGPLVITGIPGEIFVEYGLEMKQRVRASKDRPMILAGYANDYLGYIITPRAMHTGGYEKSVARVDETAGRLLTERAMRLVDAYVQ